MSSLKVSRYANPKKFIFYKESFNTFFIFL